MIVSIHKSLELSRKRFDDFKFMNISITNLSDHRCSDWFRWFEVCGVEQFCDVWSSEWVSSVSAVGIELCPTSFLSCNLYLLWLEFYPWTPSSSTLQKHPHPNHPTRLTLRVWTPLFLCLWHRMFDPSAYWGLRSRSPGHPSWFQNQAQSCRHVCPVVQMWKVKRHSHDQESQTNWCIWRNMLVTAWQLCKMFDTFGGIVLSWIWLRFG